MCTLFFVQPYEVQRHKLRSSGALAFHDHGDALRAAKGLAKARRGVVVLKQRIDAASGKMTKPDVLAIHGRVPDEWMAAKAAGAPA